MIFDGFPRTVVQAEALQGILADEGRAAERGGRPGGRRTTPSSSGCPGGAPTRSGRGLSTSTTTRRPGGGATDRRVIQRPDDSEATVRHRLNVYAAQTAPLVEFYERSGVPVHRIDGDRDIDVVQTES